MKLVYGQYGCFVADLSLFTCIDDEMMIMNEDADEPLMTSQIVSTIIDNYTL